VRIAPEGFARAARRHGALSAFDGVCATAGERSRWRPGRLTRALLPRPVMAASRRGAPPPPRPRRPWRGDGGRPAPSCSAEAPAAAEAMGARRERHARAARAPRAACRGSGWRRFPRAPGSRPHALGARFRRHGNELLGRSVLTAWRWRQPAGLPAPTSVSGTWAVTRAAEPLRAPSRASRASRFCRRGLAAPS
jgi:hypothetical protein